MDIRYPSAMAGGGCGAVFSKTGPSAWITSEASVRSRQETIIAITTPAVAWVLPAGARRVPTVRLPGLPYGLRAVRIELPLKLTRTRSGRLAFRGAPEPRLIALDRDAHVIPSPPEGRREPLSPRRAGRAPCSIAASGLEGLQREWSHLATAVLPAARPLIGRGFQSCIDVEYYLHNWLLDVALLLDAAHPGSPPASIPGLRALAGHEGVFNGPGDFRGELTALRQGAAWLVVAGGRSLSQRLEVLRHLTSRVHI